MISEEYIIEVNERLNNEIMKSGDGHRPYGFGYCDRIDDFPPISGSGGEMLFYEEFLHRIEEDACRFVREKGLELYLYPRFERARTDFLDFKGCWLWKRNLRGVICDRDAGVEWGVELIYTKDGEWKILENKLDIIRVSELQHLIEASMPHAVGAELAWRDSALCVGLGWGMLDEDWKVWEEKKKDYLENPSKYEDITLYDEEGRAYVMQDNERRLYHPESGYWNLLTEDSDDELSDRSTLTNSVQYHYLDYEDLSDGKIYPLPGLNKFVKEL